MAEVIDTDLGWKDIVKKFGKIDGKEIRAGVLESAGSYANGMSIAEIATYNHFGTRKIPARPFIAIATDENMGWSKVVAKEVGGMIDSDSVGSTLNSIGNVMKDDIKDVIGTHKLKANAPITISRKGHALPLIGLTFNLYDSIDYEVK